MSGAIEQVELFRMRIQHRDLVFTKEARDAVYEMEFGNKEKRLFPDLLSWALTDYQQHKDLGSPLNMQTAKAELALNWIHKAYAMSFLQEGPGIFAKVDSLSKENAQLRQESEQLRKDLEECTSNLEKRNKWIPSIVEPGK